MFSTGPVGFLQAFCPDDHAAACSTPITDRRLSAARTRRWVLAATPILAAHLGLALLMHGQAEPIVEVPQTPPMMVELVEPPPRPPPPPRRLRRPSPRPSGDRRPWRRRDRDWW